MKPLYLILLAPDNRPIYTVSLNFPQQEALINQFVVFSVLDYVKEQVSKTNALFFKRPIQFEGKQVYYFVSPSGIKFLLLSPATAGLRPEDVKALLSEVHESYVRQALNPFYDLGAPITDPRFISDVTAALSRV